MAGLGFARSQLEKQGWTEGKGLGKEEDGISKPIKVGIKNDTQGVGYKISDQFTFHWWDHVFNKTAKSIVVQENEDGVHVTKDETSSHPISNKRPSKHSQKPLLYGRFVKASSTATLGDMERDSDSSDDEAEKDFSSGYPEDIVFKACGGRTAHKGARHGLKLNGKLKRIEEQERIAMSAPCSRSTSPDVTKEHDTEQKTAEQPDQLKSKKKKRKFERDDLKSYSDSEACVSKKKKTKKKKRCRVEPVEQENEVCEEDKSKKKKRTISEEDTSADNEESNNRSELQETTKKNKNDGKMKNENMDNKAKKMKNENTDKKGKKMKNDDMDGKKKKEKKRPNLSEDEECLVTDLDTSKESGTTRNKRDKIEGNSTKKRDNSADTEDKETRKTKKRKDKSVESQKDETKNEDKDLLIETEESSLKKKKKKKRNKK